VCNAENNRALCEECLLSHAPNNTANGLESLEDFMAGEFIYSDMQKTIETLENKLSESYFQNMHKVVEETFNDLQAYFTKVIQETKENILASLKSKRFERHFILTSWKRLQENLESKLEVLTEQSTLQKKDLDEYIGMFQDFKARAKSEQSITKLEEEFEKKLLIEDETLKELKGSLLGTLDAYKKNIWDDAHSLAQPQTIDCSKLEVQDTIQIGNSKKGFRHYGLKYLKELDVMLLYDREFNLTIYDFLSSQVKEIGKVPQTASMEYVSKYNKVLLGGKGCVYAKDLIASTMKEELKEVKIPIDNGGYVTSLKYLQEKGIVLCSGLFPNIYYISLEGGEMKIVDKIVTNEKNDSYFDCSCMYYIKGKDFLVGGLELGHINIYKLEEKAIKYVLKGHTQRILVFDYNYTRDILVSGSKDGSIRVWMYRNNDFLINQIIINKENGKIGGAVSSLQFINNTILMSVHRDVYIKFWDSSSGKEVGKKVVFKEASDAAQFIEERRTIVSAEYEKSRIGLWRFT